VVCIRSWLLKVSKLPDLPGWVVSIAERKPAAGM
jgi:hypothetical protein